MKVSGARSVRRSYFRGFLAAAGLWRRRAEPTSGRAAWPGRTRRRAGAAAGCRAASPAARRASSFSATASRQVSACRSRRAFPRSFSGASRRGQRLRRQCRRLGRHVSGRHCADSMGDGEGDPQRCWSSRSAATTGCAACRRTNSNATSRRSSRRAKAAGSAVILAGMEAPPNFGADYTQRFRAGLSGARRRGTRCALVPFLLDGVAGKTALNQADGIHPNRAGAQRRRRPRLADARTRADRGASDDPDR